MRRHFVFSAVAATVVMLFAGCSDNASSESDPTTAIPTSNISSKDIETIPSSLEHPVVVGFTPVEQTKSTLNGLQGSVKVSLSPMRIQISNLTCNDTVKSYAVTVGITTIADNPGQIHVDVGLRTSGYGDTVLFAKQQPWTAQTGAHDNEITFVVATPAGTDVHIDVFAAGGDSNGDKSGAHFDQLINTGGPTIPATQCGMDA